MKNETWLFVFLYNFFLMGLIGLSICITKSLIPLMALIFSLRYSKQEK